jgi:hypothetical protein
MKKSHNMVPFQSSTMCTTSPKVMALASTTFLPHNNNMASDQVAFNICFARARQMEAAQHDTYRQVTREDGSFHYPQITERQLGMGSCIFETWK